MCDGKSRLIFSSKRDEPKAVRDYLDAQAKLRGGIAR